jgi:hypothetical protein
VSGGGFYGGTEGPGTRAGAFPRRLSPRGEDPRAVPTGPRHLLKDPWDPLGLQPCPAAPRLAKTASSGISFIDMAGVNLATHAAGARGAGGCEISITTFTGSSESSLAESRNVPGCCTKN